MMDEKRTGLIGIYYCSPIEATMIKAVLQDFQIWAYVQDEFLSILAPIGMSLINLIPCQVWVKKEDSRKAMQVIDHYNLQKL